MPSLILWLRDLSFVMPHFVCVRVWACSVISDSLGPHGLEPARLLCPWNSPGKNTGAGCHFLLQVVFPTQGCNPGLLHCKQILYCLSHQGSLIHNIMAQKGQSGCHPHCKKHSFCWYLWAKNLLITTRKIYFYYIQSQVLPILSMCIM